MSNRPVVKPGCIALGTMVAMTLANVSVCNATENPFAMKPIASGYLMLAEDKGAEGKCGEGKCGASMSVEGKCGMGRMDADGDGNVSKAEFMQGHEAMFNKIDQNRDGVIDADERNAHINNMKGFMLEGKCGAAK
jgi:uncharacterized low-complexity protein